MEDKKYLEGTNNGRKDVSRAAKTESMQQKAERVHEKEKEALEQEKRDELVRNELDYEEWDDAEAVDKLFSNYGMNLKEYLVDGAVLTCSKATTEIKTIKGEEFGTGGNGINGEKKHTILTIPFSESISNKRYMATVKHYKKGEHIRPFECNCDNPPDRAEEIAAIFGNLEECKEFGTCRELMRLENEWENMVSETAYFTSSTGDGEKAEKITMMSMLFCSHGGLITPVTSGQESCLWNVYALACSTGGDKVDGLSKRRKQWNAVYLYNYFIKRGWSEQAICGLLGNIQDESQMNPGAWQNWHNTGNGYGLVQWSSSIRYLDYMERMGLLEGVPVNTADMEEDKEKGIYVDDIRVYQVDTLARTNPLLLMNSQIAFLEATTTKKDEMVDIEWRGTSIYEKLPLYDMAPKAMTFKEYYTADYDIGNMALIFERSYERSGGERDHMLKRVKAAYEWGIYFGLISEQEAIENLKNGFGAEWDDVKI